MKATHISPLLNEGCSHLPTSQRSLLTSVCAFADLPAPESGRPVPRVITFQRKRANRRVINEDQLVRMLREFAEVTSLPGLPLSVLFSSVDLLLSLCALL